MMGNIELPMDQRYGRQDVERVLLGHVPFDLRFMPKRIANRPVSALFAISSAAWSYIGPSSEASRRSWI